MKKMFSIFLSIILFVSCILTAPACAATSIDYSYIKNNSDMFTFNIDDDGNAFIALNASSPTFTHKNSPEGYNSLFYSDIIITNYYTSPKAVWRIWIDYTAKKNLGISSVSFKLPSTYAEFTFNVSSDVKTTNYDDFLVEEFPIVMGSENMLFWWGLLLTFEACESTDDFLNMQIPVTLHGAIDDVTFNAPSDALIDLYLIGETMINIVGMSGIEETDGGSMTWVYLAPEETQEPVTELTVDDDSNNASIPTVTSMPDANRTITAISRGLVSDVTVTASFNEDGTIAFIVVDASGETQGLGQRCMDESFTAQFIGKSLPIESFDAITGATDTSNAVVEALNSMANK